MENKLIKDMYVTVVGFDHYHGIKPFKIGSLLKLYKEPENIHDSEAIRVEMRYAGKVGYVANSPRTVVRGTMSSGRVFDKILDVEYAIVKFMTESFIIVQILNEEEIEKLRENPESDIHYI